MDSDFIELEEKSALKTFNSFNYDFGDWFLLIWLKVKLGLYAVYFKLYEKKIEHFNDRFLVKTRFNFSISTVYQTAQALSFLLLGRTEVKNYNSFALLWNIISFVRADILMANFGALNQFLLITIVMISLQTVWLTFNFVNSIKQRRKNEFKLIMPNFARFLMIFSNNIMFLPHISVLLACANGKSPVSQINNAELNLNFLNQFFSGLFYVLLIVLACLNDLLSSEVRHDVESSDFNARNSAVFELGYRGILVCLVMSNYILNNLLPIYQFTAILFLALAIAYNFYEWFPYFHMRANVIRILSCCSIAWWCIAYIIAFTFDESGITVLLTVFITPLILVSVKFLVERRGRDIEKSVFKHLENQKSILKCELYLRQLILNKSPGVLEAFNKLKMKIEITSEKMLYIWEAQYCLGVLEDIHLARIKFAQVLMCSNSFEADFQEFCLNQELQKSKLTQDDTAYLSFKKDLDKVKSVDEKLCKLLYKFWTNFQIFSLSRMRKHIVLLHHYFSKCHQMYSTLRSDFPNNTLVKELYGGFLNDISNSIDKGSALLNKAESERRIFQQNLKTDQLDYFDDYNGIMIVSGDPNNLGRIVYTNIEAAEILGYSPSALKDLTIDVVIPQPYARTHLKLMRGFLANCSSAELNHPRIIFFINKCKFLVQCYSLMKCSALLTHPCFIILLRQMPSSSQIAMLNDQGVILSHTELFPMFLGNLESVLTGYSIEKFVPNFTWAKDCLPLYTPFEIEETNRKVMIGSLQVCSQLIPIVFAFSEGEAIRWEDSSSLANIHDYHRSYEGKVNLSQIRNPSQISLNIPEIKGVTFNEGLQFCSMFKASIPKVESVRGIGTSRYTSLSVRGSLMQSIDRKEPAQGQMSTRLESSSIFSSFPHNKQFTESILGKRLIINVKKSIKLFAISYLVMVFNALLATLYTAIYFENTINSQLNSISAENLGSAMHSLVMLADSSRGLGAFNEGDTYNLIELLKNDLEVAITDLEAIHWDLHSKVKNLPSSSFRDRFTVEWITVWEVENGIYFQNRRNLLDMLQMFIDHVSGK